MADQIFKDKDVLDLLQKYRKIWALSAASSLLGWDRNTYMPEKAAGNRAEIEANISGLMHSLVTDPEFVKLVNKIWEKKDKLNEYEKGVARETKRLIDLETKLPEEFVEKWAKTTAESFVVWQKAKKTNDFKLFEPYLQKVFALAKERAEYYGYTKHPYDALLNEYEPDLTVEDLEKYFGTIIPAIKQIFDEIRNLPDYKPDSPLEKIAYDKEKMRKLNYKVIKFLDRDAGRSRMDVSAHPFTTSMGINDVRITTWYHSADFRRSFSATVHEWGHALHALGCDPRFAYTPLEGHNSYAIAESQSRFMENVIGRNKEFAKLWLNDFYSLGDNFKKYNLEDYVHYLNMVRASLIRVEADEVTYHFHIYIRYLIEKGLLEGSIKVSEVPEVWQAKFKELLDINVPDYTRGVLQDVHWSEGYIGYFPTYSMGTFMAMQIAYNFENAYGKSISEVAGKQEGVVEVIKYLQEKVHRYGSLYSPKELMQKSFGAYLDTDAGIKYLRKKYLGEK